MKQKITKHKKLTLNEVLKRHKENPEDKDLHEFLERGGRKDAEKDFNSVLNKAAQPQKLSNINSGKKQIKHNS